MITIHLLIWLVYIALDVWINYRIIEVNDSRPNYGRLIWDAWIDIQTLYIFLYCTTSFWILFDLALNLARKKHPLYIGQHSGWIDQYGFKYPAIYYLGKLAALFVLTYSIAKIYQ